MLAIQGVRHGQNVSHPVVNARHPPASTTIHLQDPWTHQKLLWKNSMRSKLVVEKQKLIEDPARAEGRQVFFNDSSSY